MARSNPYSVDKAGPTVVDNAEGPNSEYSTPDGGQDRNSSYIRQFGWSARLGINETPDGTRTGDTPTHDYRPNPTRAPEEFWAGGVGRELLQRHTVETLDADGWEELKGGSGRPAAPNPRSVPPPEPRPTTRMTPQPFSFTRPFDVYSARQLNGLHFSMADNVRTYPIYGMVPPRHVSRNTYRLNPAPWDANLVDVPQQPDAAPNGRVTAVDLPPSNNRTWRL